jgi:hypothetical protein
MIHIVFNDVLHNMLRAKNPPSHFPFPGPGSASLQCTFIQQLLVGRVCRRGGLAGDLVTGLDRRGGPLHIPRRAALRSPRIPDPTGRLHTTQIGLGLLWTAPLLATVHAVTMQVAFPAMMFLSSVLRRHRLGQHILYTWLFALSAANLILFIGDLGRRRRRQLAGVIEFEVACFEPWPLPVSSLLLAHMTYSLSLAGCCPLRALELTYNPGFAQGIDNGSYFVGHSIFAVCIRWRETLFKWLFLWMSMVYIASSVALSLIARANPWDFAANPPIVGIFFLGLFIFSQLLRARARARARSIVKGDMQAYNALWEAAVRRDASQGGALEELKAPILSFQCCSTGAYCTGAEAVQQRIRVDPPVRSGLLPLLSSGSTGSAMNDSEHDDTVDAVRSLDMSLVTLHCLQQMLCHSRLFSGLPGLYAVKVRAVTSFERVGVFSWS